MSVRKPRPSAFVFARTVNYQGHSCLVLAVATRPTASFKRHCIQVCIPFVRPKVLGYSQHRSSGIICTSISQGGSPLSVNLTVPHTAVSNPR